MNDLTTPLGLDEGKPARRRRRLRLPLKAMLGGAIAAILLVFAGFALFVRDPLGGEPVANVPIVMAAPATQAAVPAQSAPAGPAAAPATAAEDGSRVTSAGAMEQQAGVVVVRGGGAGVPQSVVVHVPDAAGAVALAPPDPALMEQGRQGMLPRIGPGGRHPADAYARPVVMPPGLKADAPRIAILVGGMGISQSGTSEAIAKLPAAVTLAFAPYGSDLDRVVQGARGAGHEVMLQSPMEPFDYPDNDPGPQTLLTGAPPAANLDRLRWQMSRFPAYVGLTNYMGGKFTANADAFSPVLREIAGRGLIYVDDGSSPRGLAPQLAGSLKLPFLKADVVIDASGTPEGIDGALARLEQAARDKGSALGVATGLPLTLARLSDWVKGLDKRGIALVPVSALARK